MFAPVVHGFKHFYSAEDSQVYSRVYSGLKVRNLFKTPPAELEGERSIGTLMNVAMPVCGLKAIGTNVTEGR